MQSLFVNKPNEFACLPAIRGEAIPRALGVEVHRICTIRGIRYHSYFGEPLRGLSPQSMRALNARAIMSNRIADMTKGEDFPYCIWHPETATENTYRELAIRYPSMRYQVGRACAVAGYFELFQELASVPEIHIDEVARDNKNMDIYNATMDTSKRYSVIKYYIRTVDEGNPIEGNLKCDTAVCSYLEVRQKVEKPSRSLTIWTKGFTEHHLDITEDQRIDNQTTLELSSSYSKRLADVTPFLYNPLPIDLPHMNKNLLILHAAYSGNIDRYVRLRRPRPIPNELACVFRGIYHSPLFAKWWPLQPPSTYLDPVRIPAAINARFIKTNEFSRITSDTPDAELPYMIW